MVEIPLFVMDIKDDAGTTHFTNRYHTHVCEGIHGYAPEIQYYNGGCH